LTSSKSLGHLEMHQKNIKEIQRHSGYLAETKNYYKNLAKRKEIGYKPTEQTVWWLPDLNIPESMFREGYSGGSTVYPQDLVNHPTVLYVGAGSGLELLQFAYFSRKTAGVIGIDAVEEMIVECKKNLLEAERQNKWFKSEFVDLRKGDALYLPLEDNCIDVAAQNCLFNIFKMDDLRKALNEMYRVLKPGGRMVLTDPICNDTIPEHLKEDDHLRAMCITGAIPLHEYIDLIKETGFNSISIRGRWPYKVIDPHHYDVEQAVFVESVEICAQKRKEGESSEQVQVYTGRKAVYFGPDDSFNADGVPNLPYNKPVAVSDQEAEKLEALNENNIHISPSTFFFQSDLSK